jgi:hypothetical protein
LRKPLRKLRANNAIKSIHHIRIGDAASACSMKDAVTSCMDLQLERKS